MANRHPVSRRGFIKRSSAGLGLAATAAPVLGATLGANDKIKWAAIGVGGMGGGQLGWLVKSKEKENLAVLAVCDVWRRRTEDRAAMAGCKGHMDYRHVVDNKDVDAVLIATPDHWHAKIAIECLEAGKHVYLQKPMTLTVEQAIEVRNAVRRTKKTLQVGAQGSSRDQYWRARDAIKAGLLGKVVHTQASYSRHNLGGEWNWPIDPKANPKGTGKDFIDWDQWLGHKQGLAPYRDWDKDHGAERYFRFRKFWDYNGGVATDLLYHELAELTVSLAAPEGEYPTRVVGSGGMWHYTDVREVPDTFVMTADYPGRHTITLTSTMLNDTQVETRICGTEGTLRFRDKDVTIRPTQAGKESKDWQSQVKAFEGASQRGDEIVIRPQPRRGHEENFMDAIRGKADLHLSAEIGAAVMVAIKLGVESYRQNKVMNFNPDTGKVSTGGAAVGQS